MIRQLRSFPRPAILFNAALAIAAFAIMQGCASPNDKPDAGKSSRITAIAQPGFIKDWQAPVLLNPGEKITKIYVMDDSIHAFSNLNFDRAFNPTTGEMVYSNEVADPGGSILGGPIPLGGDRMAYTTNKSVELYNRHGRLLQSIPLDFSVTSGGCGFGTNVYFGNGNGMFVAVDTTRQYAWIKWEILTFGVVVSQPVAFQGEIYCASQDGSVRGFNDSKEPAWPLLQPGYNFQTGDRIIADIKADAFGVYVASTDGRLYCINRTTGKLKWQYFSPAALTTPPFATATSVYQFVPGLGLAALDKTQKLALNTPDNQMIDENPIRTPRWVCPTAKTFLTEDDKYAYVVGNNGLILALDKATGQQAFSSHRTDLSAYGSSIKKNEIYAAGKDGTIYAMHAQLTPGGYGEYVQSPDSTEQPILASTK